LFFETFILVVDLGRRVREELKRKLMDDVRRLRESIGVES